MKKSGATLLTGGVFQLICILYASAAPSHYTSPLNSTRYSDTIHLVDTIRLTDPVQPADTILLNDTIEIIDAIQPGNTVKMNDTITSPVAGQQKAEEEVEEEPKPSNWTKGVHSSLSFAQISLSNWSAGGQNSMSFNSYFNSFINYKSPDERFTWENSLDLGYGLINQEHRRTVKSDDKIDFSTKMGLRASEFWQYSSLINFKTQWAKGFKSPGDTLKISNFMAPAYLNISIGMDHRFDEQLRFYLSPLAGRVTYVLDDDLSAAGAFGVEQGENKKYEFGGFIRVQFNATLMENITVSSRLELFSNYLDKPQNMDVNSDTRINMQITRFIAANLQIQMMYDESSKIRVDTTGDGALDTTIGPRVQLKQVFGLGLSYRF